jgi:hypothetical protein
MAQHRKVRTPQSYIDNTRLPPTHPPNTSFVGLYVVVVGVVRLRCGFHLLSCIYVPAI